MISKKAANIQNFLHKQNFVRLFLKFFDDSMENENEIGKNIFGSDSLLGSKKCWEVNLPRDFFICSFGSDVCVSFNCVLLKIFHICYCEKAQSLEAAKLRIFPFRNNE